MSFDFDPNSFISQETTTASEKRPPVPAQDYVATITDLKADRWQSKDKIDEVTGELKSGPLFIFTLTLDLPEAVKEACKIKQLVLTDRVMLDVVPGGSALDFSIGKNNRLRLYREATDLNRPGEPFSPGMLVGKLLKVRVTHEVYQGVIQERAGALSKIS
jgi:hypothetical protein